MPGPNDVIDAGPRALQALRGNSLFARARQEVDIDDLPITPAMLDDIAAADAAMTAKATETAARLNEPGLGGAPAKDKVVSGDSWLRSYPLADIYYSKATGAHEVHGDIRRKYDILGGAASVLGLPVTDETGTPDGHGAYNHFQGGSIYWSGHTGPMMVTGRIQDVWAAQGWETGGLGYPVMDEHRMRGTRPNSDPKIAWCVFENGVVVATKDGQAAAPPVLVPADKLRRLVRRFVDDEFRASPDNVGLHPPVETVDVSAWGYDLFVAKPRTVMFHLHGFHDNGLATDTDFRIALGLSFSLRWPVSLTDPEPSTKTLVATLEWLKVTGEGNGPIASFPAGKVNDGVTHGIHDAFFRGGPDPAHPEVPDGSVFIAQFPTGARQPTEKDDSNIDLIDVMATARGDLAVYLNPLPNAPVDWGLFRRQRAEEAIRDLLDP